MKIFKRISLISAIAIAITLSSCKKLLDENPKAQLYLDYIKTEPGIRASIASAYRQLSGHYSSDGGQTQQNQGTDEFINGGSSTSPQFGNYSITATNGPGFTTEFQYINTMNGLIGSFITESNSSADNKKLYMGQAQFLRAFYYFYLVQLFGGATANNPSGIPLHTAFATEPSTADSPAKLADIYNQIIIDFTAAATNLPNTITSTNPFSASGNGKTATSAVAQAMLAKVYLTRGYTSAGSAADFQKAADLTKSLIDNRAIYGLDLWEDFTDALKQSNDYGKENMLMFDVGSDPTYSGYCCGNGRGTNTLPVLYRWSYNLAGVSNGVGVDQPNQRMSGPNPVIRDVYNGRSYVRVAVNRPYAIDVAFANQTNDSRFDGTFQTFWIANQPAASGTKFDGTPKGALTIASNVSLTSYQVPIGGDTAILMPQGAALAAVNNARRDAFKGVIITPVQYNNNVYPAIKKWDDQTRIAINDHSTRPVLYMRFAEVYMINAEANYMAGNIPLAVQSLNVIRSRASFRKPEDGLLIPKSQYRVTAASQAADNAANRAAMQLTPAQIAQLSIANNTAVGSGPCGMDLILEEYTREFYGDPRRWMDLVRTGQLLRRTKMFNSEASANIKDYHALRPIPQGQINAVLTGPKYPQNPGY
ncbi:RagB/SusD family nutrient uptake outer membrane protein [Mucilaginibacter sp. HD30]